MKRNEMETVLKNLDQRLERVEQFLPTVATKDDLGGLATHEELQPLATKEDLNALATKEELKALATMEDLKALATKEDLKALATREEMHAAIQVAVAPLATREEMHAAIQEAVAPLATRDELLAEGARTRGHFDVVAESLREDIRLVVDSQMALAERLDRSLSGTNRRVDDHETRITRLEAQPPKR